MRARVRKEPDWLPRAATYLNLHALGGGGVGSDPMHISWILRPGEFPQGQGSHLPVLKLNPPPAFAFPGPAYPPYVAPLALCLGSSLGKSLPEVPRHTGPQAEQATEAPRVDPCPLASHIHPPAPPRHCPPLPTSTLEHLDSSVS